MYWKSQWVDPGLEPKDLVDWRRCVEWLRMSHWIDMIVAGAHTSIRPYLQKMYGHNVVCDDLDTRRVARVTPQLK